VNSSLQLFVQNFTCISRKFIQHMKIKYEYVDKTIILKRILKKQDDGVDWMHVAKDREKWRVLFITGLNVRIP